MKTPSQTRTLVCMLLTAALPLSMVKSASGDTFDLKNLQQIDSNKSIPAAERLERGVEYLKEELANPSTLEWGMVGGPIDTGYIQAAIVAALKFPGAEDQETLRRLRDQANNSLLKDRLTIVLADTGASDTIGDLLRIARKDPVPYIRRSAVDALFWLNRPHGLTKVSQRAHPSEHWHPLDDKTMKALVEVLLLHLQDTYKHYDGPEKEERSAYHVLAASARGYLRALGYTAEPTSVGWRVADSNGQIFRIIPTKEKPLLPHPVSLPSN